MIDFAKKVISTCLDNDDDFSDKLYEALDNAIGDDAEKAYDTICEVLKE